MPPVAFIFCAVMVFMFLSPRSGRAHVNVVSKTGQAMTRNLFMLEGPWVLDLAKQHGLRMLWRSSGNASGSLTAERKNSTGSPKSCVLFLFLLENLGMEFWRIGQQKKNITAKRCLIRQKVHRPIRLFLYALTRSLHFASQFPPIRRKGFIQI